MTYYQKHLFFCTNQRKGGRKCCQDASASEMRLYAKNKLKELGMAGVGGVRVNSAGCLGRCAQGPSLVIYPEGVWYTYHSTSDIDDIIERHIIKGEIVDRLLMEQL